MAVDSASATGRIAQALESVIRGLGLTPVPVQFARRKKLQFLDGDKLPMVVIAVSDDEEFEALGVGREKGLLLWAIKRSCAIALAYSAQGRTGNNEPLRIARDQIWAAITMGALQRAGLTEANDVSPSGRAIFGPESTPNVDWSVLQPMTIETLEERPR